MLAVEHQHTLQGPFVFGAESDADAFIRMAAGRANSIRWSRFEVETGIRSPFEAVAGAAEVGHDAVASPIPLTDLEALLDRALQREDFRARRVARRPAAR
jgi:hypothetical protein